ncbi:UDP-N-acetylglucosamine-N-acetylmuramylpentapeptide N-acetylglucosamine transferase [Streptohalobacillus salinus]|uniref:UDP-N-acetylglucosamine--N-acetylmuramyl-(pentapeptide) pyrophosphoryl-undecaprenol N-acetylglucosamine transferase n=1 Tax=Streptohalobacillus salinus TaxID=621096 RepID=A0A2V3WHH2_9BACI|nr:undecaprenyldiphospho-muramoylpentapeptide beta-N-acetylglucosaminyltransferase [Streptohalobacillus salinus]PXW93037.1 UDP-N-acetylglucosamine-N-acetylmuramylpentapeptide N-acetylglucosamine transferase [Streptohalobacillus salinus]
MSTKKEAQPNKQIILTGGGTAGHVMVNLALIPLLKEDGYTIDYIGSKEGIERELIEPQKDVTYHAVHTGKLRRYLSIENFKDPFKVMKGVSEAARIIRKKRPQIIFSKGGFVSVPVLLAARLTRTPAIIHESDLTPGLANKIAMPFAKRILVTFAATLEHVDQKKARFIGPVVRPELFAGDKASGLEFLRFKKDKPVLLVMGGSAGSKTINDLIRNHLDDLTRYFQVVHLTGKGHLDETIRRESYRQFEYVDKELKDILHAADVVISRAGANAIFECLALKKPMLLIPLSKKVSRGDQLLNAHVFEKQGYAHVLDEDTLTSEGFLTAFDAFISDTDHIREMMQHFNAEDAIQAVLEEIHHYEKPSKSKSSQL